MMWLTPMLITFLHKILKELPSWSIYVSASQALDLKRHLLVAFINRNGKIIIPSGQDTIERGDTVMVVTTHTGFNDITDILK